MSVSNVALPTPGAYAPAPMPALGQGQDPNAVANWGADSFNAQAAGPYASPTVDSYATTGQNADPNAINAYSSQGLDSYASTGMQAQNTQATGGLLGGLGIGRLVSWAAGGFAAFKWVLPMLGKSPAGWMVAGVIGAGAFVGNWLYGKLTGK